MCAAVCVSCSRHVGYFRLVTPAGVRFGHRIWADVFVENSNVASVLPSLVPPPAVKPAVVEPAPVKPVVDTSVPVVVPAPVVITPAFPMLPTPSAPVMPIEPAPVTLPDVPMLPAPEVPAKWESQLLQMAEMGFYDIDANVRALESFGGNVTRAVDSLLQ